MSGRVALAVELDLRNAIYAKLVRLSFGYFDRQQTGQLMSRATVDLQAVRFFLGYGLIFFFQHVFTVVAVGVLLFIVSWKLALVVLIVSPVMIALAYHYSRVSHPVLRDVQQRMADVATVAEENIVGVHVVKAFAQEQAEQDKFERRSEALFGQSVRANRQRSLYVPLLAFLPLLAQAAVLLVGGRMVEDNTLSTGDFVAFNLYLSMAIFPLRMLGMWIGEGQRATASGERIFQVIDEPEEIRDRPGAGLLPPGPGRVRFEGVRFGYYTERPVLDGIDLELEPGRTVALIGHTGSGKTTLASLIPRFYDASAGSVTIDGADVRDVTLNSLRREIGVIAQDPFLFSATVRENLLFGRPEATDEEIHAAARLAQAHEFIERLPDGYDTVIGERGITLSGGQRQRLAIARALVVDPRILILDDATASVDASTEARIRLGLREAMRGTDNRDHRPPGSRRSRWPTRSSSSTTAASWPAAITTRCSRRTTSTARSTSTAGSRAPSPNRTWPNASLAARKLARLAQEGRRRGLVVGGDQAAADGALPARAALPREDARRGRLAARRDGGLARAADPDRSRRRHRHERPCDRAPRLGRQPVRGVTGPGRGGVRRGQPDRRRVLLRPDLLDGLGRRADARGSPKPPVPPPAAALARLLRAQPRRCPDQPADERRRSTRPARHRRLHLADPEHAHPVGVGVLLFLPPGGSRSPR